MSLMKYDSRRFWYVLSVMLVGGVLGIGSALMAVKTVSSVESVQNGPWQTSPRDGAADANRWLRTAVALSGLFAQRREETVYYTAFHDSDGERLREGCTYFLTGRPLPARWWSITLYARDHFLIPNSHDRWSVNMEQAGADAQGQIQIQIGGPESGDAWIPSDGGGDGLSLSLRLYDPDSQVYEALESTPLFSIDRADCA